MCRVPIRHLLQQVVQYISVFASVAHATAVHISLSDCLLGRKLASQRLLPVAQGLHSLLSLRTEHCLSNDRVLLHLTLIDLLRAHLFHYLVQSETWHFLLMLDALHELAKQQLVPISLHYADRGRLGSCKPGRGRQDLGRLNDTPHGST